MTNATSKVIDNFYPMAGGGTGGFLVWLNCEQYIQAFITISIGAILGWFIKLVLDWWVKPFLKKLKNK